MSNQISFAAKQAIIDSLTDLDELKDQAVRLAQNFKELSETIKNENFAVTEAVRKELEIVGTIVNGILQQASLNLWDTAIAQMDKPEGDMSVGKADILIEQRRVEIKNLVLTQRA